MSSDTVTLDPPRCPGCSLLQRSRPADSSAGSYMILLSDGSRGSLECQDGRTFQCAESAVADDGVAVVSQRSDVTLRSANSVSNGVLVASVGSPSGEYVVSVTVPVA